jgi:hypothetical protein
MDSTGEPRLGVAGTYLIGIHLLGVGVFAYLLLRRAGLFDGGGGRLPLWLLLAFGALDLAVLVLLWQRFRLGLWLAGLDGVVGIVLALTVAPRSGLTGPVLAIVAACSATARARFSRPLREPGPTRVVLR